jgi:TIGR03009 family protein
LDPANNPLDALLMRWEQEMTLITSLDAELTRTTDDKTFGTMDIYLGKAKYLKPNLAMLEMRKKDNPQMFEKYVCTGTYLYEYVPRDKEIRVHEMPPPKPGQVADDNFLSFLFGMKAEEAKRRYDLKLVKEDAYYLYVEILPRTPADKVDFQRARLVLNKKTFLPRQLAFEQPNGNQILWDIPRIVNGAQVSRAEFERPEVPSGWNMKRVVHATEAIPQNEVPPRVVRPQQ